MTTPRTIVVVAAEDDRFADLRRQAADMAEHGASVILYDVDAASAFSSPVPTEWSADGAEELVPERMDPQELDAQGRTPIADQVRELRAQGIDAWGWLPQQADDEDLRRFAERAGADVVLAPPESEFDAGYDPLR